MSIRHWPAAVERHGAASSNGAVGAASELVACAELTRLGFYVYRCESPAAPFDLVAYRDGRCLRVEVKSLSFNALNAPTFSIPKNDEWDLLAIVGKGADLFVFEAGTGMADVRDVIRTHYGFPPPIDRERAPCGTPQGYRAHNRRKEPSCRPCIDAFSAYGRERKAIRQARLA